MVIGGIIGLFMATLYVFIIFKLAIKRVNTYNDNRLSKYSPEAVFTPNYLGMFFIFIICTCLGAIVGYAVGA